MRISRRLAIAVMAGIAAIVASAAGAAASPAPVTPAATAAVTPGYTGPTELQGVAAASDSSAWAVGSTGALVLMLHWNGRTWSRVTKPSVLSGQGELRAVTVVSASDAWAVGYSGFEGETNRSLLLHWNGKAWSQVTTPAPVKNGVLTAVTATASGGWAVGYATNTSGSDEWPFILRLSGAKWSAVKTKLGTGVYLSGVATTGAKTTWATGDAVRTGSPVLAEWNGSSWKWVQSIPLTGQYHAFSAIAANSKGTAFVVWANESMEWIGKAWKKVTVADTASSTLGAVTFAPGGAVWAAGYTAGGQIIIMRWTGKEWAPVASPSASTGIAALSFSAASYGWAVGGFELYGDPGTPLILHWNGRSWR